MNRTAVYLTALALTTTLVSADGQRRPQSHGRLFPPQDLGLLEAPDRDSWQHPDEVMDKLGIAENSVAADIGAGSGWFTIRLARRVGPNGRVYAEDVQPEMVTAISRRASAEGLVNIQATRGTDSDPKLPGPIDAALLVDSYHEVDEIVDRITLLRNLGKSVRPGGRIGIIDFTLQGSGPGPEMDERISPETVINEARQAGLKLLSQETFLPYQFFLIFGLETKPPTTPVSAAVPGTSKPQARSPRQRRPR